jgi:hypothetical protein
MNFIGRFVLSWQLYCTFLPDFLVCSRDHRQASIFEVSQIQILDGRSDSIHPGSSIQMDKDHLPLLEDQNPVRRSEILSGTGRVKISLTNAVKKLVECLRA